MNNYYNNDALVIKQHKEVEGHVSWQSPSNIALIKYWGKRDIQIPMNPSISFTLDEAHTKTTIEYSSLQPSQDWIDFEFEGSKEPTFKNKIEKFLTSLQQIFPFLSQLHLKINSSNSFPHSSGIASSASSMSALSLCLCAIERELFNTLTDHNEFLKKASFISRLGSGSASRSVYGGLAVWGASKSVTESSDYFAIQYDQVDPYFTTFHDDVAIISGDKKSVSSTAGHALMDTNIFSSKSYEQARINMSKLLASMRTNDVKQFIDIVEEEAMTLHALMMCSNPSYILMKPNTIECIERIRRYRKESNVPILFTLDAGPNVHILYPDDQKEKAQGFIENQILELTENNRIIYDHVGSGPKSIL